MFYWQEWLDQLRRCNSILWKNKLFQNFFNSQLTSIQVILFPRDILTPLSEIVLENVFLVKPVKNKWEGLST